MNDIEFLLQNNAALVMLVLNGELPVSDYINALLNLIGTVQVTSNDDIKRLSLPENVISTILADKVLIETRFTKEPDHVSMFSTLVAYYAFALAGEPDHSRKYMDAVTALRHKIDAHYQEETQKFCGS